MNRFACLSLLICCAFVANAATRYEQSMVKLPGKGTVAFVNAAGTDASVLELAARKIGTQLMVETVVLTGSWSLVSAPSDYAKTHAVIAVFVVKDATLPPSLIALEKKWGVVNVAGLSEKAVTKEAVRVAAVLLGSGYSKYKASVLRPVFSPEAIANEAGEVVTIDAMMAIQPSLELIGIVQYRIMPYETALEDGIAPPPANDVQRKIKEEFEKNKDK